MSNTAPKHADLSSDDADALIASLENDHPAHDEVVEEVVADLHIDEAREQALASANDNEVVDETAPETTPEVAEKNKARKKGSAPKAPKAPRYSILGAAPSEALPHTLGSVYDDTLMRLDATFGLLEVADRKAVVAEMLKSMDATAVKVKEKIINGITSIATGKIDDLSVYTQIAIDLLIQKGQVTSAEIKAAYLDAGYTAGTSASQSGQMLHALPNMLIAKKVDKGLVLNENSLLVTEYNRLKMAKAVA